MRGVVHQPLAVDQPLVRASHAGDATGRKDTPHCQTANAGSEEDGNQNRIQQWGDRAQEVLPGLSY